MLGESPSKRLAGTGPRSTFRRLSRYAAKGEQIVVPGVLLATGDINDPSRSPPSVPPRRPRKKIEAAGRPFDRTLELAIQNPERVGVRYGVTCRSSMRRGMWWAGSPRSSPSALERRGIVVVNAEKAIVTGKMSVVSMNTGRATNAEARQPHAGDRPLSTRNGPTWFSGGRSHE